MVVHGILMDKEVFEGFILEVYTVSQPYFLFLFVVTTVMRLVPTFTFSM